MMLTYAAQMRGLLADHDTPTGLIWEMWVGMSYLVVEAVVVARCQMKFLGLYG